MKASKRQSMPLEALHYLASLPPLRELRRIGALRRLWLYIREKQVPHYADRTYLETRILPVVADAGFERVLFVGCRRYTQHYGRYFQGTKTELWTTDIDPEAARWGASDHHIVCDIRQADAHFPAERFDAVLLNGVFGFGVDDDEGMNQTIVALERILKPEGILLIGWNENLTRDPRVLEALSSRFSPGCRLPVDEQTKFDETTHIFDFFSRREVGR